MTPFIVSFYMRKSVTTFSYMAYLMRISPFFWYNKQVFQR